MFDSVCELFIPHRVDKEQVKKDKQLQQTIYSIQSPLVARVLDFIYNETISCRCTMVKLTIREGALVTSTSKTSFGRALKKLERLGIIEIRSSKSSGTVIRIVRGYDPAIRKVKERCRRLKTPFYSPVEIVSADDRIAASLACEVRTESE